jgi:hypothetical protein
VHHTSLALIARGRISYDRPKQRRKKAIKEFATRNFFVSDEKGKKNPRNKRKPLVGGGLRGWIRQER